jgi:hypothetical protein
VTGIKLARTPSAQTSIADRNQYTYFNSAIKKWQKTPLIKNDATGNIITWSVPGPKDGQIVGPNVGDVWYDYYHKTTVMLWNDAGIDGTFWFRYVVLEAHCLAASGCMPLLQKILLFLDRINIPCCHFRV